jgi:NAD(P)-dependent dehydrogenase (short-subunit alcohol dehydrogenase family)
VSRFSGKVAIVTGGASGIGEAVVRGLLLEGAKVASLDINATLLAQRQQEYGATFFGVAGDVTNEASVAKFVLSCVDRFGSLDMAFNVAGASKGGPIVDHSLQDWGFTIDLCLSSVLLCLKYEARQMLARGGAIVNVSSVCAHFPVYGAASYCSAKSGVEMLTKVAALELAEKGIRVNAVLPGYTYTPGMRMAQDSPGMDSRVVQQIPLKRAATAEEIAAPALFLASNDARYVTGASLVVDGGWELTACPDFRPAAQAVQTETIAK